MRPTCPSLSFIGIKYWSSPLNPRLSIFFSFICCVHLCREVWGRMAAMVNIVCRHMRAPLLHTTYELGLFQSMEVVGACCCGCSQAFGLYKGLVKGLLCVGHLDLSLKGSSLVVWLWTLVLIYDMLWKISGPCGLFLVVSSAVVGHWAVCRCLDGYLPWTYLQFLVDLINGYWAQ